VKSFFFTFIGAMLGPPWGLVVFGILLGVLLLAARIPAAWAVSIGSGLSRPAKGILAVAMPRGMAAGVLAMMPFQAGVAGTEQLSVVVFATVFTSILIFATGFPILKGRLARSDPSSLVQLPPDAPPAGASFSERPAALADSTGVDGVPAVIHADATTRDPVAGLAGQPADATTADQAIPLTRKAE
jgi:hypothetical protein